MDDGVDLLLTDYRMPGIDGLQLARTLRLHNPMLPVMIVSAMYGDMRDAQWEQKGIVCLPKPLRYHVLEEHIHSLQFEYQGQ